MFITKLDNGGKPLEFQISELLQLRKTIHRMRVAHTTLKKYLQTFHYIIPEFRQSLIYVLDK
jgi:hypothetical protein